MEPSCPNLHSISVSHIDILPYHHILVWHVIEVWESKRRWRIYVKGRELFQTISKLYLFMNAKSDYKANQVHKVKYAFVQLALTIEDNQRWNCPWKHCSDNLTINCSWTISPIHIKHKKACFQRTPYKFSLLGFPGKHEYSG